MAAARSEGDERIGILSPSSVASMSEQTDKKMMDTAANFQESPFKYLVESLECSPDKTFFNVSKLQPSDYDTLPYCIRVVLEAVVRNCDGVLVKEEDAVKVLKQKSICESQEVPFLPARVVLQDFTGIPAMVDFAAMRDVVKKMGRDPSLVNPVCATDLIADHSLQLDFTKCSAQNAPSAASTESHRPISKLSPAKSASSKSQCRGQSGCKGACNVGTSNKNSREQIENTPMLCPFHLQPIPEPESALKSLEIEFNRNKERLQFLKWCSRAFQNVTVIPPETGTVHQVNLEYLSRVVMDQRDCLYPDTVLGTDSHTTMLNGLGILALGMGGIESEAAMLGIPITLNLPGVVGCELTGSISPFATSIDVVLSITKHLRQAELSGKFVEFFGEGVSLLSVADRTTIANMCPEYGATVAFFPVDQVTLSHLQQTGKKSEVCRSCVLLGLLAKKAVEAGLKVKPYINTSMSPGSGTVTHYLTASGVLHFLNQLGFDITGYGCSRCVGSSSPLPDKIVSAIKEGELVACGIFSGSKNFEGNRCSCIRANYLASPPLVIAYALAGTVNIDLQTEALGEPIVIFGLALIFSSIVENNSREDKNPAPFQPIEKAHVLLYLGDSVTTDHISPAGSIPRASSAAKYLSQRNLAPREFNSYGARRGNDAVMTRGTFANIKLQNKLVGKMGPKTIHFPSGQMMDVFDASELYQKADIPLIIIAGKKYGSGNSRDWAAKGPFLLGVRAVIAESYEKIHKDQLVGIGIAPLQFLPGDSAESLGLSGKEQYSISIPARLAPGDTLEFQTTNGKVFHVNAAFDKEAEVMFYKQGGILNYVTRKYV
ncbi:iron-responsive element-binding protein 2 [Pyxicephalus adspersus]|uniref:iron-responsive element-binding protein 2 n=1 Tax=Pyxicephalus adspersus TaxID=30357 RepID=UPI003B5A93CB